MAEFYKMNPAQWDFGTASLTLEQEAAYLRIVNAINKHDAPVPDNPHVLAGMFRCNTRRAKRLLDDLVAAGKLWVEGGKIFNEHAMNDVRMRGELRVKRQIAGHSGGIQSGLSRSKPLEHNEPSEASGSTREEKRREESSDTNVSGGKPPPDPVKVMFDAGVSLMGDAGVSERQARSLLGKWKSQHGTEAVLSVLGRAQREGAIDPVAFCEGCFRQKPRTRHHQDGDRMEYDDAFGGGPLVR